MNAPVLDVSHLVKTFDGTRAVDTITFRIERGEIFGLLGPNGAGKTTTIHMLLGVLTPDAGDIRVFGKSLAAERETALQQMNFSSSYVALPWNLTVDENLRIFGMLYRVQDIAQRIRELLELFGLGAVQHTLTGKLSSGQLTRLFLAKALINRPLLLLLDEPTASLDPDIADRTRQALKELSRTEGITVLYTSHNMVEVESLCQRIVFLHHGRILASGTPSAVVAAYGKENLEDVFLHVARTEARTDGERA